MGPETDEGLGCLLTALAIAVIIIALAFADRIGG
jgi:hypothetical protein